MCVTSEDADPATPPFVQFVELPRAWLLSGHADLEVVAGVVALPRVVSLVRHEDRLPGAAQPADVPHLDDTSERAGQAAGRGVGLGEDGRPKVEVDEVVRRERL